MAKEIAFDVDFAAHPFGGDLWIQLTPRPGVPTLPFPIQVRVVKSTDGRLVCTGMRLGEADGGSAEEITAPDLRRIPLSQILPQIGAWLADAHAAIAALEQRPLPTEFLERLPTDGSEIPPELQEAIAAWMPPLYKEELVPPEADATKRRPGPPGKSTEFYRRIANLYREALEFDPKHPARYVAEHATEDDGRPVWPPVKDAHSARSRKLLQSHEATARKWVYRARQKGLMGGTSQGKAGERRETP